MNKNLELLPEVLEVTDSMFKALAKEDLKLLAELSKKRSGFLNKLNIYLGSIDELDNVYLDLLKKLIGCNVELENKVKKIRNETADKIKYIKRASHAKEVYFD